MSASWIATNELVGFVKLAIISVSNVPTGELLPSGLLPVVGETVLQRQIAAALTLGTQKIILASTKILAPLIVSEAILKRNDVDISVICRPTELMRSFTSSDEVIVFADGALPDPAALKSLSSGKGEYIITYPNSSDYSEFELIDSSDRWAGVMKINARRLLAVSDLPNDWDMASTLLRLAIQSGAERLHLNSTIWGTGAVVQLTDYSQINRFEHKLLAQEQTKNINFLSRFVLQPLIRYVIGKLWQKPKLIDYILVPVIGLPVLALLTAYKGWVVPTLMLLLLSEITAVMLLRLDSFASKSLRSAQLHIFERWLMIFSLALLIYSVELEPFSRLIILTMLAINTVMLEKFDTFGKCDKVRPDVILILAFLIVGAVFGQFLTTIYLSALISASYVFFAFSKNQKA